ncbi:hypothetical protein EDB81DRAFT_33312 [Dactylonectria macrodidyma]|uniref:Tachykinin family protein n=1 Tax=Dactylonectria macrodidyma TaxID=307937 RepID=A0A9P9FUE6_9HYPO|nr:hypothetical protein EDB81DRAFT_33312 [Dactylonectria macrodidyma]
MSRSPSSLTSPSLGWSPQSETPSVGSHDSSPPTAQILPCRTARPSDRPKQKPAFLFIDSQADNAKSSTVSKQKQAFLLRKYHQEKKQASIDRLKAPKSSSKPYPRLGYPNSNFPTTENDKEGQESQNLHAYPKRGVTRSEMWSLKAYLSQGYADPFSSYAVHMTDSMNMYFHHCAWATQSFYLHPSRTKKEGHQLIQRAVRIHTIASCYPLDSTRMSIWWWQKAIALPALLQALLFLTAGHHATLESNNGVSSLTIRKTMNDSLHLRSNTLKTLNNLLQDPAKAVAESTTLIVASLVAIEAVDANFEALQAHQRGLKRLIDLMGGLDALDHMTLSKIYQSDVKSAALMNSRPAFPMSAKFRSEILQESKVFQPGHRFKIPPALAPLGARFTGALWYEDLHPTMQTFIEVFRRLILYYEIAMMQPKVVMPTDNDLFLVLEHQLLSISYTPEGDDLNEPLRLSLLIYLNLRVWHFQAFPFMQYMVEALKRSLAPKLHRFQTVAPDLSFWVLFIGGMASQGYTTHPWFVTRLTETTQSLEVEEWTKARVILGEYFYTDQPGETGAEDLWNEVLVAGSYSYIAPKPTMQIVRI